MRFHRGELLTSAGTARLLDLMQRVSPGDARLKGELPPGTPVAHKTGTRETDRVMAAVNDVGILTLPGGAGHVAIVAFVSRSDRGQAAIEHAIARISLAVFDHWSAKGERFPDEARLPGAWSVPDEGLPERWRL